MSLEEFVTFAPLTLLLKSDGVIQPIIVGSIWRCLVSSVAMKGVSKGVAQYLKDFHFGVGVSSSIEVILLRSNMMLSKQHVNDILVMLTVDFLNTLNMVRVLRSIYFFVG